MNDQKVYVQYGAGNEAIEGWVSFDASPTLRIQKFPIIGKLLSTKLNCILMIIFAMEISLRAFP